MVESETSGLLAGLHRHVELEITYMDRTSLVIYASSVSNKWGDTDPGSIEDEDE